MMAANTLEQRRVRDTALPARAFWLTLLAAVLLAGFGLARDARAEYADAVINNYSDGAGMRPVIFPHWFHRVRFRCKVCHTDLGFKFKVGGNDINMLKIIDGQFCGACHNGSVAWSVSNCDLCHSGKPGTPTQLHESTINILGGATAPAAAGAVAAKPSSNGKN